MKGEESIFAVKLNEIGEQYGKLACRIRICEQGGRDKIHSELEKAEEEYKENTMLLEQKAKTCRSRAVNRLSQAQLDYRQRIGEIMKSRILSDIHTRDSSPQEDEEEAELLYAEFAMDFATLAVQEAFISVLTALEKYQEKESDDAEESDEYADKKTRRMKGEGEGCRK